MLAIELNDARIAVASDGKLLFQSPGYALLEPGGLVVGQAAEQKAYLKPTQVNNFFWERLSTAPLPRPGSDARSYADLATAHLDHIWQRTDKEAVIFTIPGYFEKQQLGLLLGIAKNLSMPVRGLVDSALVAANAPQPNQHVVYIDISLHRTTLTLLKQEDRFSRVHFESIDSFGLNSVQTAWVRTIADLFIRLTRFDPLHEASTEQALYNKLPDWIDILRTQAETTVEILSGGAVYSVRLQREMILEHSNLLCERISQHLSAFQTRHPGFAVQLSHRLAGLPGLIDGVSENIPGCDIETVPPGAAPLGALRHAVQIGSPGESIVFISSLVNGVARENALSEPHLPTHILLRSVAYPITEKPLTLSLDPHRDEIQLAGAADNERLFSISIRNQRINVKVHKDPAFINSDAIDEKTQFTIGDVIRCGASQEQVQLIALASPERRPSDRS